MIDQHVFLEAFTIVLVTAAITTFVFQKLKQPVLIGYLMAGVLVGPYLPTPLVADKAVVQTLSDLGVVLLLFCIGLDFSLSKFLRNGLSAGVIVLIQSSMMLFLGYSLGRMLGWSEIQSLFAGGMITVSSTAVVTRVFNSEAVDKKLKELVLGITIAHDLVAILMMAGLTAIATGSGLSIDAMVKVISGLVGFLVVLILLGVLIVPRMIRIVYRLGSVETNIVTSIGLCFAFALLAKTFGYSMALGAFIAGSLVAETGFVAQRITKQIAPIRDLFTAVFFVSVGMQLDPFLAFDNWAIILAFTILVLLGQALTISVGALISGRPLKLSIEAGLSLAQIGEFSFLIAGIGLTLGVVEPSLFMIAVSVALITAWLSPFLVKHADQFASIIEHRLPAPLQTFTSLYGSWLKHTGDKQDVRTLKKKLFKWIRWLLFDLFLLLAISMTMLKSEQIFNILGERLAIPEGISRTLFVVGAATLIVPLFAGIIGLTARIARELSENAFPKPPVTGLDTASAPRKAMAIALHFAQMLLIGVPLVTLLEPIAPTGSVVFIIGLTLLGLGVVFWKSAQNLDGHVQAGAQVIASALRRQIDREEHAGMSQTQSLDFVHRLLPGMGDPVTVLISDTCDAVGKSLAELNLRALTGATIMAISSEGKESALPASDTVLKAGDIVVLSGSEEAIEVARLLLKGYFKPPSVPSTN
jgi:CPA2 family monovalent cation:H+ antiporter-2